MKTHPFHIPHSARQAFLACGMATASAIALAQTPQDPAPAPQSAMQSDPQSDTHFVTQHDAAASFAAEGSTVPKVQTENGVNYLSGGVGIDERDRIKDLTHAMNLQLVFAEKSGALLADVEVRVAEAGGGEVLSLPASDPLVFADLQPGTYQVAATVDGRTIEREVIVPARGRHTEVFHWG